MPKENSKYFNKCDQYLVHYELWRQVRAAIKGKYAVNKIIDLLPGPQYSCTPYYQGMTEEQINASRRVEAQNNLRIQAYWSRGRFFNATGRTQESLDGMIWAKEPEKEIPSQLDYLKENADGEGNSLREVAQETTYEVISVGRYGVLIDMPSGEASPTMAEMESGERAPRMIQYHAEQIIFFVNNGMFQGLDEVRLVEQKQVKDGDDWKTIDYVRRLVMINGIYHNQLWTENDEMISDVIPFADGRPLNFIPFQFFGADNNSPEYSKVPMYDLANVNLGHYVLDCDNRDNLHYHGQGMTAVYTGMSADEFYDLNPNGLNVGAKGMNQLEQGDRIEVIQIEATGAIPAEMERDEKRMIYLGAQLVQDTNSNQTLGAKEMEFSASTSTLKRIARNVSKGLTQCLEWVAIFMGVSGDIRYQLNTEFVTDMMDAQMLAQHFNAVQSGLLPKETYYEAARKAGITDKTNEELEELAEQGNLDANGTNEEMASLQAKLDAALEEIERLNG